MRKFLLFSIVCIFCMGLIGCATYSSANMARIHSDSVTVLGPWGFVHTGANTAITFYTSRQTASKSTMGPNGKIDWPTLPTIQEDSNANLNIGKASKLLPTPKVVVPESTDASVIQAAAAVITK